MVIQGGSVGQGGPVNTYSIAAETGAINLTRAEFDAVVASETPASDSPSGQLVAPEYDLNNCELNGNNLTIAWHPVVGATHYRLCIKEEKHPSVIAATINNDIADIYLATTSYPSTFTIDSGLITGTSYTLNFPSQAHYNIYVFSYNNIRGLFPTTQAFITDRFKVLQVWHASSKDYTFFSPENIVTYKNLYTGFTLTETFAQAEAANPTDLNEVTMGIQILGSKTF